MKYTGDKIRDTVLKNFRELASPAASQGHGVDIESLLERAISGTRHELSRAGYSEKSVREHIWEEEDEIRATCRKIVIEIEKRHSLLDIRKTSIEAVLNDFASKSGLSFIYKLRDNNTVGFRFWIPGTGQYLKLNASFSKILSEDWLSGMETDLKEFIAIATRFGKIKVSSRA